MTQDSVTTNYNDKGMIIMEMIYGDGFLSPNGAGTAQSLVRLSNFGTNLHVLDIGSGIGGSAFHLAEHRDCMVQGIDLMDSNVIEANRRSAERDLSSRARFTTGNATRLPFPDEHFDIVWGQDAWLHIEDKQALVSEANRVLVSGGRIIFSDWLLMNPWSNAADEVRRVTASPTIADKETYLDLLREHRLKLESFCDTSIELTFTYNKVLKKLRALEPEICGRFGQKVFDIVLSKQEFVLDAFSAGVLGTGSFVARKF